MKLLILPFILFLFASNSVVAQREYATQQGSVTFNSSAPLENIKASSVKLEGKLQASNNKLSFVIPINSFSFANSLMQEHFNDKFMESHRYPQASFTGAIVTKVDLDAPGTQHVVVKGVLQMHGVDRKRTIQGTITNVNGKLYIASSFQVKLTDHHIEVPELVYEKIAEVIDVKLKMELEPVGLPEEQIAQKPALRQTLSQAEED